VKFVSLFAGIGGIDLGLERAGHACVAQVEIDPYCRRVLAKHWPDVWRHDDVRTFDPTSCPTFDAITAGFPCQDVSNAGKRAGVSASRSGLYREVVRCLCVARPKRALLENVAALLARGMGTILGDLATIGYDAEWDCVPACSVGAPHCRDRVFIVADSERDKQWRSESRCGQVRRVGRVGQSISWDRPWQAALAAIRGVDDGLPRSVERTDALRNAVVPQVAEFVGRHMLNGGTP